MAPKKRKAAQANLSTAAPLAKKLRRVNGKRAEPTAAAARSRRDSAASVDISPSNSRTRRSGVKKASTKGTSSTKKPATRVAATPKAKLKAKLSRKPKGGKSENTKGQSEAQPSRRSSISVEIPVRQNSEDGEDEAGNDEDNDGKAYWLMKAEPESRIEKGKDVKFSIDDLKNAVESEGWDGVRNPAARNNMRAMKKGDLAFFYHSNCKIPGIAGVMEIVQEHTTDESAFDTEHPYHDPKSTREDPKWDKVHVEFRRKFPELISLKEMQKYAKPGGVLEHLQTLKMSRLSVSKVTPKQWNFIMSLIEEDDELANSVPANGLDHPAEQAPHISKAPVARMGTT